LTRFNYCESYHPWFNSNYFDSYHCFSLTLVFGLVIRFTWLVNRVNLHYGQFESIHYRSESYQSSCFILLVFLLSESNHTFSESIQYVVFGQNIVLPPFSIYTHILLTPKLLNHLHLLSLESSNLIVYLFLRLNTFSKNHCGLLSHRLLECYKDYKLIALKDIDWESRI
jgi:hypothetical protein